MSDEPETLASLEDRLGYVFTDPSLLLEALTHTSFSAENSAPSYERLEFLGDAVLGLVTASTIFDSYPEAPEGEMTKLRAVVVDRRSLAAVGRDLGIPDHIRLGRGEDRAGGRDRDSIVSDVVEAILGAVYIDGGWAEVARLVRDEWRTVIDLRASSPATTDPRSRLQELLAKSRRAVSFSYEQSGPDHAVVFMATASVEGETIGTGTGGSKKSAAIDAARDALESIAE
ncbi:MAG: ribonuclease III [Actinomycetia bacterium]|nr:ribonuclease III [Actinomycetes bacterium]